MVGSSTLAQLIELEEFPRGVGIALEIWAYQIAQESWNGASPEPNYLYHLSLPTSMLDLALWLFGKFFWGTNKTTDFYQPQRKEGHQIVFETYRLFSFAITYLPNIS